MTPDKPAPAPVEAAPVAGEPTAICYRCQMRLPERLTTYVPGPRGGVDALCAACDKTVDRSDPRRIEVVAMRKAPRPSVTMPADRSSITAKAVEADDSCISAGAPDAQEPCDFADECLSLKTCKMLGGICLKQRPDLLQRVSHQQPQAPAAEVQRADYTRVFEDFWRPLISTGGMVDMDKVARELFDYHEMLDEVPKVYDHVTRGRISKPNTVARCVIAEHDDVCSEDTREAVAEETAELREQVAALTARAERAEQERDTVNAARLFAQHVTSMAIAGREDAMREVEATRTALAEERRKAFMAGWRSGGAVCDCGACNGKRSDAFAAYLATQAPSTDTE